MNGITGTVAFVVMWAGFLALMIAGLACILFWAIRTRQFKNQDRARYLPLKSGIPEERGAKKQQDRGGARP